MYNFFSKLFNYIWYKNRYIGWVLWPFSLIFIVIAWARYKFLKIFCEVNLNIPVIVVGNISVGGVGKTPLVIAIANELKKHNLRVGIVSRGYGAKLCNYPHKVLNTDTAKDVGDEPLILAKRTECPVVIDPNRVRACNYLLSKYDTQVIISDDGLQHYKMGRSIEIVVVDGKRLFGNGLCLPAGPLRERTNRLKKVEFLVVNGSKQSAQFLNQKLAKDVYAMDLAPEDLRFVATDRNVELDTTDKSIAAIAGIGNPDRFFSSLNKLGFSFKKYIFSDHYSYTKDDFLKIHGNIIMTEKDAVKCSDFSTNKMYYLPVKAVLDEKFWQNLLANLGEI